MVEGPKRRGFDALDPKERRRMLRRLLDKAAPSSPEQEDISVLLLMGIGMTEEQARADLALRRRHARILAGKKDPPWMR